MKEELDLTLARFDKEWKKGDRDLAKKIAAEYIKAHKVELAPLLMNLTIGELVELIEQYRAANQEGNRIIADMWLLTQPVRAVDAAPKLTEAVNLICDHPICVPRIFAFADDQKNKELALRYVDDHRQILTQKLSSKSLQDLVAMVDFYREMGQEENRLIADMWLLCEYDPQDIRGELHRNILTVAKALDER